MTRDEDLQDRLRRLASAAPQEASLSVERELRARFRARRKQSSRVWTYAAGLAAALLVAIGLLRMRYETRTAAPESVASGFIALPYAQSGVPVEEGVIVRVRIPVSELGLMGVPVIGIASNGKVSADLLVGQDGVARALRFAQ